MKFSSAAAPVRDLSDAVQRLCAEALGQLEGRRPDLALVFVTSHFEDESDVLADRLTRELPDTALIGCTAEGVIGPDCELERTPAAALMLASLPHVKIRPFTLSAEQLSEEDGLATQVGVSDEESPAFLFFGDPFSMPVNPLLERFNTAYPGRPVLGGMASGCEAPGQAVLLAGHSVHRAGGAGVAIWGPVDVRAVVSQGCRPIGRPLVITRCRANVIQELGGRPALLRLREIVESLPPEDTALINRTGSIFLGRVIDEYKERFAQGDFLIRNVIGFDSSSGALAVGEEMRVGATVQFHIRDGDSADQDMRHLLAPYAGDAAPAGAMLFSCNGRGTRMWEEPNHDVAVLREVCGPVPVAGFFAAGELGPVGGRSFIHGHTASMGLFRALP